MNRVSPAPASPVQEPFCDTNSPQAQVFGRLVNSSANSNVTAKGSPFLPLDTLPVSVRERIVGTHCACPHLYDYVHRITLNADQSAKLVDGAGQCLNSVASGQWALSKSHDPQKYTLHISNPQEDREYLSYAPTYCSFKVDFLIDAGEWTKVVQSPARRRPGKPIQTLTCFSRLVFDQDPLKLLCDDDESKPVNLYNVLSKDSKFLDSERTFYAMDDAAEGFRRPPLTERLWLLLPKWRR